MNSSLRAGSVTLASPLAPGGTIGIQFKFGVEQPGTFKIWVNVEALTVTAPAFGGGKTKGGQIRRR
jgi:hypothetical protein